ncbi:MAG: DUF190 domain-containing protein [Acidobacteria bacterium]|nr:DUF190 domain-containing protein [Acidobacteriota bacterium]MCB9399500.1 DUF190 domain-containing protein [Acidobacteriota bacterium]
MKLLRFYLHDSDRHQSQPLWEWLLEQARALNLPGGSAFRAMAGFGRHQRLHEERFLELADLPVVVEFVLHDEEHEALLDHLERTEIKLLYSISSIFMGSLPRS